MALIGFEIQDAQGDTTFVPLDTIAGETFRFPGYKFHLGAIGADDGPVSAANPLPTNTSKIGSVVDANNSSTTPLLADAVFTGTGTDLLGFSTVCITIHSDVDSATDGMTFQFSTDNVNWDDVNLFELDASESTTRRFQFPVTTRYFRVVYTNGTSGQAEFRLQTILHTSNQLGSIHRLKDNVHDDRSVTVVKSVVFAQQAGGGDDFVCVQATNAGNFKVSLEEVNGNVAVDADTGVGTDNRHGVALLRAESGGSTIVGSANPLPTSLPIVSSAVTGAGTATIGATSSTVIAANATRKGAVITNISDSIIYLGLTGTAVVEAGIPLYPNGGHYEIESTNLYTGIITAISTAASKKLCFVET